MIMRVHPIDPFTPEAARRWKRIPQWAQNKILENVFCGQCAASVLILLETADMKDRDLVLRGKCSNCGKAICRVVEPESD